MHVLLLLTVIAILPQQEDVWRLGTVRLEIGAESSGGPDEFGRIAGVVRLPDGSIVVGDQLNDEVRAFDSLGRIRWVRGRSGGGPGEFQLIKWLGWCAGSIMVVDGGGNRRVTRYASSGTLLGTQPTYTLRVGQNPWAVRCDDQQVLVVGWPEFPTPVVPGPIQPQVAVGVLSLAGDSLRVLGRFPGPENYVLPTLRGAMPRPLGASIFIAILHSRAFVAVSNRDSIYGYDLRSRGPSTAFRVPLEPRRTQKTDINAWINAEGSGLSDRSRAARYEADLKSYQWPDEVPRFVAFVPDPLGNLWLRPYTTRGAGGQVDWRIVDVQGRAVARVSVPADFDIHEVGSDWILGVERTTMGVERVVQYHLHR